MSELPLHPRPQYLMYESDSFEVRNMQSFPWQGKKIMRNYRYNPDTLPRPPPHSLQHTTDRAQGHPAAILNQMLYSSFYALKIFRSEHGSNSCLCSRLHSPACPYGSQGSLCVCRKKPHKTVSKETRTFCFPATTSPEEKGKIKEGELGCLMS